jgi:hypothetical protein
MPNRYHFQTISNYRELPPRIRIIYSKSQEQYAIKEYADLARCFVGATRLTAVFIVLYSGPCQLTRLGLEGFEPPTKRL